MEIKLKKLILENFKGIRKFTLEPEDTCLIKGANATCKTTLFDGFLWLLFGKDSQGKADFALKTLKDGQVIPNLDHSVEAIFDIDGQILTLKKVLKEHYTKKKGSSRADFTGHETDHYIDGVPIQKKEWDQRINDIIDEETFKLLTSPTYFNQSLHWEKRRSILLEICGDISDSDVIASDKALAALPEILGNKSIEDQKKVIAGKRKEINQRLTEIPSRIDELDKSLDVSGYDLEAIQVEIRNLDGEIEAMRDNTQLSNLRKQKAELQAELSELGADKERAHWAAAQEIDGKIEDLEKELRTKRAHIADSLGEINRKENAIKFNEKEMTRLREEYKEINSLIFNESDYCYACGQLLPKT